MKCSPEGDYGGWAKPQILQLPEEKKIKYPGYRVPSGNMGIPGSAGSWKSLLAWRIFARGSFNPPTLRIPRHLCGKPLALTNPSLASSFSSTTGFLQTCTWTGSARQADCVHSYLLWWVFCSSLRTCSCGSRCMRKICQLLGKDLQDAIIHQCFYSALLWSVSNGLSVKF